MVMILDYIFEDLIPAIWQSIINMGLLFIGAILALVLVTVGITIVERLNERKNGK